MLTLNIELSEPLTQDAQVSGFSKQQLQSLIMQFVETFLGISLEYRQFFSDEAIPADISFDLIQLDYLDDDDLWHAAQTKIAPSYTEQMQQLLDKREFEGLTTEEQALVTRLSRLAQRTMLVRAKAAVLLKQRGFDITSLRQQRSWA